MGRQCHTSNSFISSIEPSYDSKIIASRGGDDTLKTWDFRNLKKCLASANNLYNRFQMTNCMFSPNDKYIVTGTSTKSDNDYGKFNETWDGLDRRYRRGNGNTERIYQGIKRAWE